MTTAEDLAARFKEIVWADDLARAALLAARAADLPNWRVVSGVLYNAVWNRLTGRPSGHGVKDVDLAYFDAADLSFEAEDRAIRAAAPAFAALDAPVEIRNQARVHLWFKGRFGQDYPPLDSVEAGIRRYPSRTHAVGVRLEADGSLDLYAPFGLEDIFAMRVTPNRALENRKTHEQKAARAKTFWPEVSVEPW